MKTRLYHKFIESFIKSGKSKRIPDRVDKYLYCARAWHIAKGFHNARVRPIANKRIVVIVNSFRKRYERYSRKYWTSSAKLRRAIIGE